jgi:hypothetical protein
MLESLADWVGFFWRIGPSRNRSFNRARGAILPTQSPAAFTARHWSLFIRRALLTQKYGIFKYGTMPLLFREKIGRYTRWAAACRHPQPVARCNQARPGPSRASERPAWRAAGLILGARERVFIPASAAGAARLAHHRLAVPALRTGTVVPVAAGFSSRGRCGSAAGSASA